MQNLEYRKNMDKNYLIVPCAGEMNEKDYQVRMICENRIDGLLSCKMRNEEGISKLFYEVDCCQELKSRYEYQEIPFEECKKILMDLAGVLKNLQEYLLEERFLVLDSDGIYWDSYRQSAKFLFLPSAAYVQHKNPFCDLAEFLLEKVDHTDDRAVKLIYYFYKEARTQTFHMSSVMGYIEQMEEETGVQVYTEQNYGYAQEKEPYVSSLQESMQPQLQDMEYAPTAVDDTAQKEPIFKRHTEKKFSEKNLSEKRIQENDVLQTVENGGFSAEGKEMDKKEGFPKKLKVSILLCAMALIFCIVAFTVNMMEELKQVCALAAVVCAVLGIHKAIEVTKKEKTSEEPLKSKESSCDYAFLNSPF